MMTNLKEETLQALKDCGKTIEDVLWIGNGEVRLPIDAFLKAANRLYDDGYGGVEVIQSLVIVGDNWWLERGEYDGSEWWEFKTLPCQPRCIKEENICDSDIFYQFSGFDF